ncbi:hypothetical protein [Actinomadura logoneensis]|uniref:hypothetical protein n=1 Tax=Actinomadura logoneensis TaxID=2293572 RepID=UPI001F4018BB|nr:hypothetical protein [Actinomadura logoneensis]
MPVGLVSGGASPFPPCPSDAPPPDEQPATTSDNAAADTTPFIVLPTRYLPVASSPG